MWCWIKVLPTTIINFYPNFQTLKNCCLKKLAAFCLQDPKYQSEKSLISFEWNKNKEKNN